MKKCYFCKGSVEVKKIEHLYHWKGHFYLFKNIKAEVCSQCGETFLFPKTLKYMDQVVQSPGKIKQQITIPVFSAPEALSA